MLKYVRIVETRFKHGALSGEGARLFGGRWNTPGRRACYLSANTELALLESTIRQPRPIDVDWHLVTVEIEDQYVQSLDISKLPANWRSRMYMDQPIQHVLDQWFENEGSVGIIVPSALVPTSSNIVLNPNHLDFQKAVVIVSIELYTLY